MARTTRSFNFPAARCGGAVKQTNNSQKEYAVMNKKSAAVIDRAVIRGADEIVRKCVRNGRRIVGKVRRYHLLEQAVLAVEHEVAKDPEGFAR